MGISIEQYRCRIGSFNCRKRNGLTINKSNSWVLCLLLLSSLILIIVYAWLLYIIVALNSSQVLMYSSIYINYFFNFTLICKFSFWSILLILLAGDVESNPGPYDKDIKICHINIRSLKAKFENSITRLDLIQHEVAPFFDIITVSETWLNDIDNVCDFLVQGFQEPFLLNRPHLGGGVLCWVSDKISAKRRADLEVPGLESLWLEIRSHNNKFLLCTTYRPPNDLENYWVNLQNSLDKCDLTLIPKIMIIGDLNADPLTLQGKTLLKFASSNNFKLHIDKPTRITDQSSTILDQCLCNFSKSIVSTDILPPLSTNDHCTISVHLDFKVQKSNAYKRTMWDFSSADVLNYQQCLSNINWDHCFENSNDIDDITNSFSNNIMNAAKSFIKHKEVIVRPNDKAFYNGYLRRMKRKVNRLHHTAKSKNTSQYWEYNRQNRNFYFREVKRCKLEYYENIYTSLDDKNLSAKSYFSTAKKLLPFKKQSSTDNNLPPIIDNDNIVTDDLEKAGVFNNFFAEASKLDESQASLPINKNPIPGISLLSDIIITEEEVQDQISLLKTNKGFGPDLISPKFIKMGGQALVRPLTRLFNTTLILAKVPKLWKRANVIPIHKKGPSNILSNYRPVSLLSTFIKIMERIIFKHLYNHFQEKILLSVWQSGFRPGSSTVTQLLELYDCFCKAVDNQKEIRVVFLDISKAFDKVWHLGLLFKLKKWGISGKLLEWIQDYLKDRMQRVVINGQKSEWTGIKAGVPQGSVLGPLLFLVFINDIVHVVNNCEIRIFADDTCLHIVVDNKDDAARLFNEDLQAIETWANRWLVDFSAPKTESMTISTKIIKIDHPPLIFCGSSVTEVTSHKHVGLWLDNNLGWYSHINYIEDKANKRMNMLSYFKYKLSRNTLERIYYVFIRPILEYGNIVWIGANDGLLDKIDKIETRAMRLVTGATNRTNINSMYIDLQWQSIRSRRDFHALKMMFKIINRMCPEYLYNLLPRRTNDGHNINLRYPNRFIIPKTRVSLYKKSFFPRTISLWNDLTDNTDIYDTNSVSCFHYRLKNHKYNRINALTKHIYGIGPRSSNVVRAKLRLGCSNLNDHLFNNLHVLDQPVCQCGAHNETVFHFFFECRFYETQRDILVQDIQGLTLDISVNTFLHGDLTKPLVTNVSIIRAVDKFLNDSLRFT